MRAKLKPIKEHRKENWWNTSIALPVNVVEQIDNAKGDIDRSLWMRRAILKALKDGESKQNDDDE